MLDLIWLIPALPLAGFILILLFGRLLGEPKSGILAASMVGASFAVTVAVFFELLSKTTEERHHVVTAFSWVPIGSLNVDLAFLADPLSITMALFVTGIGSLIHLYAIGYMHGDPKFSKFFLYLNLFVFSMLMLVMGENLLVTFLGWEGVGTCSYFLISFWHTRESAATAGKKAFVTNRVGDWGVMMAMFLAFGATGTLSYAGINHAAESGALSAVTATGIAMMLFIGACGKSAQLPLYIWLPDAMEGPTPVSALIHAATMVTAGVFVMTRINPVLAISYDWVPTIIAVVGVATALFAATIAVAQTDIKEGLGLLDGEPTWLHVLGHRFGCLCCRDLPHGDSRFLQGLVVLGFWFGDSRNAPRTRHAQDGRTSSAHARHRTYFHHRLVGDCWRSAICRILEQGRNLVVRFCEEPDSLCRWNDYRFADCVLHDSPSHHGFLRRSAME